jgi:hypothetical protein
MTMRVITIYDPAPIPDRRFDWTVIWDGYEAGDPKAYGATREEALEDFKELMGITDLEVIR